MNLNLIDRTLGKVLALGVAFTTVFILSGTNTDPVNVTKLFALGISAVSAGSILIWFNRKILIESNKLLLSLAILFFLALVNTILQTEASKSQSFYGTYGRNTGFLTYFFLLLILLASSTLNSKQSIVYSIKAMFFAGFINVFYCGWVLLFGDFIGWNNPYGNILGLFGNPNFISAFLGMFIATAIAFVFHASLNVRIRFLLFTTSVIAFIEILKSHAIQGIVVSIGGVSLVIFYWIRAHFEKRIYPAVYSLLIILFGTSSIFGALQKGPLSFLYKRSVSLRGTYWEAGINMGNQNPWHGIGMDAYGDWYRRLRPTRALIDMPGLSTLSNAAHNVFIDIFSFGGWPLFLTYLATMILGLYSILKISLSQRKYDPIFVSLVSLWICYQVQALISINQIGLAIWGWLSTGLLVAFERVNKNIVEDSLKHQSKKLAKKIINKPIISGGLVAGLGAVLGALLAVPPLNSDIKWFNAINSRNAEQVISALQVSYINPPNSFKYAQAVQLFQNSNLSDLAYKYSMEAVKFNKDYFDAWKQIYYLPNISDKEREIALANLRRLDPRNPDPTKNYD